MHQKLEPASGAIGDKKILEVRRFCVRRSKVMTRIHRCIHTKHWLGLRNELSLLTVHFEGSGKNQPFRGYEICLASLLPYYIKLVNVLSILQSNILLQYTLLKILKEQLIICQRHHNNIYLVQQPISSIAKGQEFPILFEERSKCNITSAGSFSWKKIAIFEFSEICAFFSERLYSLTKSSSN